MKYEIFCGSFETMSSIANKKARALNPKTMKWQIIDKSAKYNVVKNGTDYCPDYASLFSNKDLHKIAERKGLII